MVEQEIHNTHREIRCSGVLRWIRNTLLSLAAGYAGVHAAKKLHKAFKGQKDKVEITLIDRHRHHTLMTELHEVAGNRVEESSVKISFDRIFSGKRVNVVRDEITDIDFKKQVLTGKAGTYVYDQIIIATGAESTDFNIPRSQGALVLPLVP